MRIMPSLADDPERRLTLRQADQARSHFAEILDELDFVKALRIELLTRGTVSVPSSDSGRARNA